MKTLADTSDRYDVSLTKSKRLSMMRHPPHAPIIVVTVLWIAVIGWIGLDPSIVLLR